MKFLAKHKKLSLIFSFLAAIIFTLGGILLLRPIDSNNQASADTTVTFHGNGGTMMKNLFEPNNVGYRQHVMGDDGSSGGVYNYSGGMAYGHHEYNGMWYFVFSPSEYYDQGMPSIMLNLSAPLEKNKYYALNAQTYYITDGSNSVSSSNIGSLESSGYLGEVLVVSRSIYDANYWSSGQSGAVYAATVCHDCIDSYLDTIHFSTGSVSESSFTATLVLFAMYDGSIVYDDFFVTDLWLYETDEYGNPFEYSEVLYNLESGIQYHMPMPKKRGYSFVGYSSSQTSSELIVTPVQTPGSYSIFVDSDVIQEEGVSDLYAQWQPNTYTITLDYNCSDFYANFVSATYDQTLPNVASCIEHRPGYIFKGFYTQPSGGDLVYDALGNSTLNYTWDYGMTFYAQWEETWAVHAQQPIFENNAYQISTPEELAWIAWRSENGETFDGVNFVQTANIDLNCNELARLWCPIARTASGKANAPFRGNYNGNGYKILNMITAPFKAEMTSGSPYCANTGGLFGEILDSIIQNVYIAGNSQVYGRNAGGLVGVNDGGFISGCVNMADVFGSAVGGIAGLAMGGIYISDCINQGEIILDWPGNDNYGGGIFGICSASNTTLTLEKLTNMGNLRAFSGYSAGGIIGILSVNASFINCNNFADMRCSPLYSAGGIIGDVSAKEISLSHCFSIGEISASAHAGGMVGFAGAEDTLTLTSCYVKVSLYAGNMGGIIGASSSSHSARISQSYIQVQEVNSEGNAGAIYGYQSGVYNLTVSQSSVISESTITSSVGYGSGGQSAYLDVVIEFADASNPKMFAYDQSNTGDTTLAIIGEKIVPSSLVWVFTTGEVVVATRSDIAALGYRLGLFYN